MWRDVDDTQLRIGQANELVLGEAILGEITERLVRLLLHHLLRLEARILPVPENERGILVISRDGGLVDGAARPRRARLRHRRPGRRRRIGQHRRGRLLLRVADSEIDRREIRGPPRGAVGADLHSDRESGDGSCVHDRLLRHAAPDARERHEHERRVPGRAVHRASQDGEREAAVRPCEATVEALLAVNRLDHIGLHGAKLNAVAEPVARVDGIGEVLARLIKGELGDVADIDRLTSREIVEQQIRALRPIRYRARATGSRRRCAGVGGIPLHRDPPGLLAGEGEAAHLVELLLVACRQIDQTELVEQRATLRLQSLRVLRRGIDCERRETGGRGNDHGGIGYRLCAGRTPCGRDGLADLESQFATLAD